MGGGRRTLPPRRPGARRGRAVRRRLRRRGPGRLPGPRPGPSERERLARRPGAPARRLARFVRGRRAARGALQGPRRRLRRVGRGRAPRARRRPAGNRGPAAGGRLAPAAVAAPPPRPDGRRRARVALPVSARLRQGGDRPPRRRPRPGDALAAPPDRRRPERLLIRPRRRASRLRPGPRGHDFGVAARRRAPGSDIRPRRRHHGPGAGGLGRRGGPGILGNAQSPMKVLVSAFEPFGGRRVNASWELARRLPPCVGRREVRTVRLPVVYGASWPVLGRALAEFKPDAVVALGEAPGKGFRLERVAVNLRDGGVDNSGRKAEGEALAQGALSAYLSTLPLSRIAAALRRAHVPAEVSLSAGTYLCNETFFFLMVSAAGGSCPRGAGFIHVPRDAHQRWPNALRTVLSAL
ncbi:hypothetical protein EPO15_08825 [bacterium]|nr:MAG: hypothetical protein EPO15_08825 [bacterium]